MSVATKLPAMDVSTRKQPTPAPVASPQTNPIIPIKVAFFGEQGTGKTTSAAFLAAALSKEIHGGAPVWVTDPELGWQFPRYTVFRPEGVELVQRTVPTFKAMMQDLRDAEKAGACVWVVELQKIWIELLKTVRARCGSNWGNELNSMWTDYVNHFLNSKMHCFALGRVGDVTEEIVNELNEIQRIKIGEKMKAGGSNNFGYEPHLVLRMSLEIKPRKKHGEVKEGEGRMIHRAHVLKDRTMQLNGRLMEWSDKAGYKPGGYSQVWNCLKPHYFVVQETMSFVSLDTSANSFDMVNREGNSEMVKRHMDRASFAAEIKETLDHLFGGLSQETKHMRREVTRQIFGILSRENVDRMSLEKLDRGLSILKAFEERTKGDEAILGRDEQHILDELAKDIEAFDTGAAEQQDMPF